MGWEVVNTSELLRKATEDPNIAPPQTGTLVSRLQHVLERCKKRKNDTTELEASKRQRITDQIDTLELLKKEQIQELRDMPLQQFMQIVCEDAFGIEIPTEDSGAANLQAIIVDAGLE